MIRVKLLKKYNGKLKIIRKYQKIITIKAFKKNAI